MSDRHPTEPIAGMVPRFLLEELDRIVHQERESGRVPQATRSTILGPSLLEIAVRLGVLHRGFTPANCVGPRFMFAPLLPNAPDTVSALLGDLVWMVRETACEEPALREMIEIDVPDRLQAEALSPSIWETLWIPSLRRAVDRYELPYPTADLHEEYMQNIDCRLKQLERLLPQLETVDTPLAETCSRFMALFTADSDQLIWNDRTRETLERVKILMTAHLK